MSFQTKTQSNILKEANVLLNQKDYAACQTLLEPYIYKSDSDLQCEILYVQACIRAHNLDQGLATFAFIESNSILKSENFLYKARLLISCGYRKEAMLAYQDGLQLEPHRFELIEGYIQLILEEHLYQQANNYIRSLPYTIRNQKDILLYWGYTLTYIGHHQAALICFNRIEEHFGNDAQFFEFKARNYRKTDQLLLALKAIKKAIKLNPRNLPALVNGSQIASALGLRDDSIFMLQRANDFHESKSQIRWNLCLEYMRALNWEKGWPLFDYRFELAEFSHNHKIPECPAWQGEPLGKKTLLILSEQGFGDSIQFLRYVQLVREFNPDAMLIFESEETLHEIAMQMPFNQVITPKQHHSVYADYYIFMMSLGKIYASNTEKTYASAGYLKPSKDRVPILFKPNKGKKIKVGFNWNGSTVNPKNATRSIEFKYFHSLVSVAHILPISLQLYPSNHDLVTCPPPCKVMDASVYIQDFIDTAGIIAQLDLIVTVDTALAHLAGAMGIPCWVLIEYDNDWRWLTERSRSIWYDSIRLFRQETPGQWAKVLFEVRQMLSTLVQQNNTIKSKPIFADILQDAYEQHIEKETQTLQKAQDLEQNLRQTMTAQNICINHDIGLKIYDIVNQSKQSLENK